MKPSILIAISQWIVKNFNVEESLKEVGTEVLQKCLWSPLRNRIIKFFPSEEEAQEFVEQLSVTEATNEKKPERDVEDLYEELEGEMSANDLFNTIVIFLRENQELIKQMNSASSSNGYNIMYNQKAQNIYNNTGVQNITVHNEKWKQNDGDSQ